MNLDEFIANVKRTTGYGRASSTSDQPAKNILLSINDSMKKISRNWLWDWLHKDITIDLVPGTSDYTLDADVDSLIALDNGNNNYVRHITPKEYLLWHKADTDSYQDDIGIPSVYFYVGRNATGARIIRIDDIPSSSTTLTGFAKKKLTEFSISDLGNSKDFLPFPDYGLDILKHFVIADVYRIQGKKDLIFAQEAKASRALSRWREESSSEPSDDVTSKLPSYYKSKKIARRNGYTV